MDPNANLEEQRRLSADVIATGGTDADDAMRLAELVRAMDKWLRNGGFLPETWQR